MKPDTSEALDLAVVHDQRSAILTVNGRITIDSSPVFRARLLVILHERVPSLTVDLTKVPYVDTSGLATLVETLKHARAAGTRLKLMLHERPRYLMEFTGLLPLFDNAD